MLTRMRLLKGATGLLYLGPMIAGLCAFGWGMVLPFAAIFVVWLMILRPEQWPETPEEWLTGQAWLAALAQILSQVALVALLFAIGRGLGGLAGIELKAGPVFPLAVSFIAIPLGRMLWNAHEAADQGYFLDDEAEAAHTVHAVGEAATAVIPLLNLPDDAPDAQVATAVGQVMQGATAGLRLKALVAALQNPDRSHAALRRALILWASEPELVAQGGVEKGMSLAFGIADGNPDLLRLYVPRALALVTAFPARIEDFPSSEKLRQAATSDSAHSPESDLPAHLLADLKDGLRALAEAAEKVERQRQAQVEAERLPGAMPQSAPRVA